MHKTYRPTRSTSKRLAVMFITCMLLAWTTQHTLVPADGRWRQAACVQFSHSQWWCIGWGRQHNMQAACNIRILCMDVGLLLKQTAMFTIATITAGQNKKFSYRRDSACWIHKLLSVKWHKNSHYTIQGHSRWLTLISMERPYATSY